MSASKNGGPAFPRSGVPAEGMTLRDYFAGQALSAMSADLLRNQEYGSTMRALAEKAFFIADCMLAERSKP